MNISFTTRITVFFGLLLSVSLGAVLAVTYLWISSRAEADVAYRLQQCGETLRQVHRVGREVRMRPFQTLAIEPRFRALSEIEDTETLQHAAREVRDEMSFDAFGFLAPSGAVLGWDGIARDDFTETLAPILAERSLAATRTFLADNQALEGVVAGMSVNDEITGYIAAVVAIDDAILEDYHIAVGAHIELRAGDRILASSHPGSILESGVHSTEVPIGGSLRFLAYVDPSMVTASLHDTFRVMICLSLLAILIGGAVSYRIASAFARPIHSLASATHSVERGDLAVHAEEVGGPELQSLAANFNRMVLSLRKYKQEVGIRTKQLEEEVAKHMKTGANLRKAATAAEAAAVSKMKFLANVSHELRTPLNGIIGFAQLLVDGVYGELNSKQSRSAKTIEESGQHLLLLINDVLDLSKVESGRMELELSVFEADEILEAARNFVAPLAAKKNQTIEVDLASGMPAIQADRTKLEQILCNLLGNAVKFTPSGGKIQVSVLNLHLPEAESASKVDPGGTVFDSDSGQGPEWIEFCVRDTGLGISREDQKRIFNRFEQVDSSYSRDQEGTGLGLALARGLVELHGGSIRVESKGEEGEGSRFYVAIPVRQHPEAADEESAIETNGDGKLRSKDLLKLGS
jgi:signal transduction histidine kinase